MRISAALPHGVTALLFDAARRRRRLETRLVRELEEAGFSEVILPIVDYLDPYEPLLTAARRGELYRFIDRDGELLALRADFTPMLARLLAPRLHALELPLKVFYRGDVVRFEEERAGRQREFYQLGAELLGLAGERAEREMLRLFLRLLAAGSPDGRRMRVVLGFAGALDALLTASAGAVEPLELAEAVRRRERAVVREVPRVGEILLTIVEHGVPARPEDLGPEAAPRLERLLALRDEIAIECPEVRLTIDLAELACHPLNPDLDQGSRGPSSDGLDRGYYDGLVFRGYAGAGALPVGAGGRYDQLFRRLGARVPAVGFSLGLDRLLGGAGGSGEGA